MFKCHSEMWVQKGTFKCLLALTELVQILDHAHQQKQGGTKTADRPTQHWSNENE